jgi:DNA-binding SARP family transcriptional activator
MIEKARTDPCTENRIDWLSQAINQYLGVFSASHDGSDMGTWYARRLKSLWVEAILNLAHLYGEKNRIDQSIDLYQYALAIDDSVESVYRELIGLLYDQGRFAEAQLVFNRCHRVLSNLGLDPSEATTSLFGRLQAKRSTFKAKSQ